MQCRQPNLEGTGEIPLRRLVKEALRMRPSRIVVGEVRQAESLDLLIALNSGLPGMATIHANSAREAITKMCTLPLLAGENVGSRFVVPTVAGCVDLVVHLALDADGTRRVREVVAVPGRVEQDVVETADVFTTRHGQLVRADGYPPHPDRFERVGIDLARAPAAREPLSDGRRGRARRSAPRYRPVLRLVVGVDAVAATGRPTRRRPTWTTRLQDELRQADMASVGPRALLLTCAGAGLAATLLVLAVSSSPPIALCFGGLGAWAPVALVRARARRRRTQVREVWPEAVDHLASGIRAGLSLPEALAQLGDRGPAELRPAVPRRSPRTTAPPDVSPTASTGSRSTSPTRSADRIVEALRLTREVGGSDLGRLLRTLSAFLRDDARTRGRARGAAELDGQRGPARRRGAVGGAGAARVAPGGRRGVQPADGRARARDRRPRCRWSPTG